MHSIYRGFGERMISVPGALGLDPLKSQMGRREDAQRQRQQQQQQQQRTDGSTSRRSSANQSDQQERQSVAPASSSIIPSSSALRHSDRVNLRAVRPVIDSAPRRRQSSRSVSSPDPQLIGLGLFEDPQSALAGLEPIVADDPISNDAELNEEANVADVNNDGLVSAH